MLLHVFLILNISIVSANLDLFYTFLDGITISDATQMHLRRIPRQTLRRQDFIEASPTCEQMSQTSLTPFVVIFLYRTSGRFLGMGSIVDKKTILTAARVVESSLHKPHNLLVLAGRLSPWWGRDSQVRPVSEVFQNDVGVAIAILKDELLFNKNILPIKTPVSVVPNFNEEYDKYYAVFGVPRSSWDIPGDETSKTSIYLMKVENQPDSMDDCKKAYPDVEFNDTTMTCTFANGSYCWGCIGSPTVAVNKADKILQVAVLTRATYSEKDEFHIHVKIAYFEQWIRSHSLIGYKNTKE